ncbi:hypothetical protein ACU4GD_09090 [Cupriavidus basilensis]
MSDRAGACSSIDARFDALRVVRQVAATVLMPVERTVLVRARCAARATFDYAQSSGRPGRREPRTQAPHGGRGRGLGAPVPARSREQSVAQAARPGAAVGHAGDVGRDPVRRPRPLQPAHRDRPRAASTACARAIR